VTRARAGAVAATVLVVLAGRPILEQGTVLPAWAAAAPPLRVTWHPERPRVGSVAWLAVAGASERATIEGSVGGRPLTFFPYGGGQAALVGFDLEVKAGALPWSLALVEGPAEPRTARGRVTVQRLDFPVQRLTLPPTMVDLDRETERRAEREAERLRTLYRTISPERLWRGVFTHPLGARVAGANFGSRRVINGQPRAPHGGADYAAGHGTPVVAVNAGRVVLVADHFFPGRLVAIDHGLGLHTLYFHLERASVSEGDGVERGQVIGAVGATGRATGPHLHFGVQVGPARVDPASLFALGMRD
jgi:murein DD-endopeptidase MepM/ murein hydrolase activator NlpD